MISRILEFDLLDKIENEYADLWKIVLSDEQLCPVFRGGSIDVYYRGYLLFSVDAEGIKRNQRAFNNSIVDYNNHVFKSVNDSNFMLNENPPKEELVFRLPFYKQNIDFWFGAGNKRAYEREFQQVILRENNSEKFGNETDYFIVDMEYQYIENGPQPDLMAVKMPRRHRNKKDFRLSIIEVKYLDDAFSGSAGIRSHIDDYVRLLNDSEKLNHVKKEMGELFYQRSKLGLIKGYKSQPSSITISEDKPELLLALIGLNSNNGLNNHKQKVESLFTILTEALDEYGSDVLDSVYIAKTSEIGFGLYADKLVSIAEYIGYDKK